MIRRMMVPAAAMVLLFPAASALATFTSVMSHSTPISFGGQQPRLDPTGDTFDNILGVFGSGFGGPFGTALNGAVSNQVFPTTSASIGDDIFYLPASEPIVMTTSETPGPGAGQVTINFEWISQNGVNLIPTGSTIDGGVIDTLSFEMGSSNTPGDGLGWGQPFTFDHPESATTPGVFEASFDLLDTFGGTIFSGSWFVSALPGNEFQGRTFISAGGADLAQFGIGGARATVVVNEVPEPTTIALLGLGGMVILRRKRR